MYRYWSVVAIALAILLITILGLLTRYYIGKRLIALMDTVMLRVPLLNKVYSTIKQVNEAFSSGKKSSFKTVVMIQFPGPGLYSLGFLTSEQHDEVQAKSGRDVVCVFVPTTPNPTSGFLVLVLRLTHPCGPGLRAPSRRRPTRRYSTTSSSGMVGDYDIQAAPLTSTVGASSCRNDTVISS